MKASKLFSLIAGVTIALGLVSCKDTSVSSSENTDNDEVHFTYSEQELMMKLMIMMVLKFNLQQKVLEKILQWVLMDQ